MKRQRALAPLGEIAAPDETEFRSFRIVDGVVTEEEVRITADTGAGAAGPAVE